MFNKRAVTGQFHRPVLGLVILRESISLASSRSLLILRRSSRSANENAGLPLCCPVGSIMPLLIQASTVGRDNPTSSAAAGRLNVVETALETSDFFTTLSLLL